jgi:hypothetical protein
VAIYIVGRLYGEINANKDYIEISTSGIKFRETPGLGHGWLPISKMLMFEDVKNVDVIQTKNVFNSDSQNLAIYLIPNIGKPIIMGSKLNPDQIAKVGFALKGSVAISNTLQRFIGEEGQVKDILDSAKEIWQSFRSKEN